LIMMSGSMGHVINWFYENNQYYVIDYMCVAEERESIFRDYSSNAKKYVEERIGRGSTLKDALSDYQNKNISRSWYFNNQLLYSVDMTGYDFYHAECNTWSKDGFKKRAIRTEYLYFTECSKIEKLYVEDGYRVIFQPVGFDLITCNQKTVYPLDVTAYVPPLEQVGTFDNTSPDRKKGNSSGNAGSVYDSSSDGSASGSENSASAGSSNSVLSGYIESCLLDGLLMFEIYENGVDYIGIPDGANVPSSLTLPSEVNGRQLIALHEYALCDKTAIKELHIPSSVVSVGKNAFLGMNNCTFYVKAGSFMEQYCITNGLKYKTE